MSLSRERRSRGAEERRSRGAEEQRSRGAEERRKKKTIFLNPWSISICRFFLEPLRYIWELTKCTTF
ncbi:MAG: hypothetical protein F6K41_28645 [Symploca sp. SIO3E6]|nr:hypothetical protein [Caldora sp. SIO3E6]